MRGKNGIVRKKLLSIKFLFKWILLLSLGLFFWGQTQQKINWAQKSKLSPKINNTVCIRAKPWMFRLPFKVYGAVIPCMSYHVNKCNKTRWKKCNFIFEIFVKIIPHTPYDHKVLHFAPTIRLWYIGFFQPIWNDFWCTLNLRLRVNCPKMAEMVISNPHNFTKNNHRWNIF